MFWYCITCQCLTPIFQLADLSETAGVFTTTTRANSLQDAIVAVIKELVAPYKEKDELTAVVNYQKHTLQVLDEKAHIVNYFWGFRGHRI